MNTNTMELNMNKMELVNGCSSLGDKLLGIGACAGSCALGGAVAGGIAGSIVPGFGTLLLGGAAAVTGGILGTGIGVIKVIFFDD